MNAFTEVWEMLMHTTALDGCSLSSRRALLESMHSRAASRMRARSACQSQGVIVVERKIKAVRMHRTLGSLHALGTSFLLTLMVSSFSGPEPGFRVVS